MDDLDQALADLEAAQTDALFEEWYGELCEADRRRASKEEMRSVVAAKIWIGSSAYESKIGHYYITDDGRLIPYFDLEAFRYRKAALAAMGVIERDGVREEVELRYVPREVPYDEV